jgi:hypothetical protein
VSRWPGPRRVGADPVGDKGVVAPVGEQLGLFTHQAGAAHDQPVAPVAGLGDLGQGTVGIDDRVQASSGMVAIAARIGVVWRTVIE